MKAKYGVAGNSYIFIASNNGIFPIQDCADLGREINQSGKHFYMLRSSLMEKAMGFWGATNVLVLAPKVLKKCFEGCEEGSRLKKSPFYSTDAT